MTPFNEIEAKFMNVELKAIRARLRSLKAKLVFPERPMLRIAFEFPDERLDRDGAWLRVRDEGDQVTLSYKRDERKGIGGMEDITITVGDFERTCTLLERLGLTRKSYQETERELWNLDGVEVTIDTWPWLNPFVEIEGSSEDAVRATAERLGFFWKAAIFGGVALAYMEQYDISYETINRWPEYRFGPRPDAFRPKATA